MFSSGLMMDVRWKQRFQNFDKAFVLLRDALEARRIEDYSDLEQEGLIQRFEYTYELAWKLMKDFLEYSGVPIQTPIGQSSVIKAAFSSGLVKDGQVWMDMMSSRNRMSHVYDGGLLRKTLAEVKSRYLPCLGAFRADMKGRLSS